ncbi:MAG: hypothetical protein IT310_04090 [Anaerolineales bacterium]|nr:hypothetical protein [Anaerolineales bacterium]
MDEVNLQSEQTEQKKNGKNKVLIIVGVIVGLCCCLAVGGVAALNILAPAVNDTYQQIQDQIGYTGLADEQLKADTLKLIAEHENSQTGCTDVALLSGQTFLHPGMVEGNSSAWAENWQVMACDASHLYMVTFMPSPTGGTDISISRMDN